MCVSVCVFHQHLEPVGVVAMINEGAPCKYSGAVPLAFDSLFKQALPVRYVVMLIYLSVRVCSVTGNTSAITQGINDELAYNFRQQNGGRRTSGSTCQSNGFVRLPAACVVVPQRRTSLAGHSFITIRITIRFPRITVRFPRITIRYPRITLRFAIITIRFL